MKEAKFAKEDLGPGTPPDVAEAAEEAAALKMSYGWLGLQGNQKENRNPVCVFSFFSIRKAIGETHPQKRQGQH